MNFTDTFNRADNPTSLGTPSDAGPAYSVLSGTWGIESNAGFCSTTGSNVAAVRDSGSVNGTLTCNVSVHGADFGIVARAADNSNYILLALDPGAGRYTLYKQIAGSFTQVAQSGLAQPMVAGQPFSLECTGTNIKVYDTSGGTAIDTTITELASNTKWGMREFAGSARFDSLTFTAGVSPSTGEDWKSPIRSSLRSAVTRAIDRPRILRGRK